VGSLQLRFANRLVSSGALILLMGVPTNEEYGACSNRHGPSSSGHFSSTSPTGSRLMTRRLTYASLSDPIITR
jgi:hypothetical protein